MKKFVSGSYRTGKTIYQSELLYDTLLRMKEGGKFAICHPKGTHIFKLIEVRQEALRGEEVKDE